MCMVTELSASQSYTQCGRTNRPDNFSEFSSAIAIDKPPNLSEPCFPPQCWGDHICQPHRVAKVKASGL